MPLTLSEPLGLIKPEADAFAVHIDAWPPPAAPDFDPDPADLAARIVSLKADAERADAEGDLWWKDRLLGKSQCFLFPGIFHQVKRGRRGEPCRLQGVGLAKRRWFEQALSAENRALHRRLKDALDPAGVLNPGKFLG